MSQSTRPALLSDDWWRVVLPRAARQAIQTATPVIAAAAAGSVSGYRLADVLVVAAVAVVVTIAKAAAGWVSSPGAPLWVQAVDRAGAAAFGVIAGVTVTSWAGLLATDWRSLGLMVVGAVGLSLTALVVPKDPTPAVT